MPIRKTRLPIISSVKGRAKKVNEKGLASFSRRQAFFLVDVLMSLLIRFPALAKQAEKSLANRSGFMLHFLCWLPFGSGAIKAKDRQGSV